MVPVVAEMLKVAKANEAGRHAGHYGGGFQRFAAHRRVRPRHAQRARGGHMQGVHGFAAQKLPNAAAQDRAAIAHARKGRQARTLELNLQPIGFHPAGWRDHRPIDPPTGQTDVRYRRWPGSCHRPTGDSRSAPATSHRIAVQPLRCPTARPPPGCARPSRGPAVAWVARGRKSLPPGRRSCDSRSVPVSRAGLFTVGKVMGELSRTCQGRQLRGGMERVVFSAGASRLGLRQFFP